MFHERLPETYKTAPAGTPRRRDVWASLLPRRSRAAFRLGISASVAVADFLTICGTGLLIEAAYFYAMTGQLIPMHEARSLRISGLIAIVVLLTNLFREEYSIDNALALKPHLRRAATLWLAAWAVVLVLGFATKTTTDFSRVVAVTLFVV